MLEITNTYIKIDKEFSAKYFSYVAQILKYLTYIEQSTGVVTQMFNVADNHIRIPIGYLDFLNLDFNSADIKDLRESHIKAVEFTDKTRNAIASILPGIILRPDQVEAVLQALHNKNGIYQMATGAGKTEVISAIIKYWHTVLKIKPNIIILEPTVTLVNQTIERFAKYGINATAYNSTREISGIQITHPASLYNDIAEYPKHLKKLNVIICDEGHHLSAITWRTILDNADNLEVRLAFSASIIENDRVDFTSLSVLDFDEHLIVGAIGKLIINYPPAYYIRLGILATPVVFRLTNAADEVLKKTNKRSLYKYNGTDYHAIKKYRLGSEARIKLTAETATLLVNQHVKILILVDTKDQAMQLLASFGPLGISDKVRAVFGGQQGYKFSKTKKTCVQDKQDVVQLFRDNEINVLIGTSVMYEGTDLPILDFVFLYSVGVEQRVFIQTIGRVLRKGKSGKYAYIVDFTDHTCKVLNRHSLTRKEMYLSIIGVEQSRVFDFMTPQNLLQTYISLEDRTI